MVQTYFNMYAVYPDNVDNLVDGTSGDPLSYVQVGSVDDYGICYDGHALLAGEDLALLEAGITTLVDLVEDAGGDWNPTFWPYNDNLTTAPTTRAVAEGENVLALTTEGEQLLGLDTAGTYVVFGLNVPCSLFRRLAAEPAYHFADTPAEDPATFYMAFAVVYQISSGTGPLGEAIYKGALAFHDFGPSTAGMHTKEWWSRARDEREE
jgi:hypothetical protein